MHVHCLKFILVHVHMNNKYMYNVDNNIIAVQYSSHFWTVTLLLLLNETAALFVRVSSFFALIP
jgi:hypothetical protein